MDSNKSHYVVATGVVVKDGKFLITKRASNEKAFPNRWVVPGGKVEMNDYTKRQKDSHDAWYNILEFVLRREVNEETGLKIKNIHYLTSLVFIRPDNIPVVVVSFFAAHDSGEVKLCPALTEYAWVTVEEAKKYDLISGIYEELEMVDKHLKGHAIGEWKKNE
ncbi:NUDIX domain-containing protein [Candidatus Woesearchaeota archaeon]|nr:NUDIX domain-containing protein [Candidatus Woesearchaeota archaeon]